MRITNRRISQATILLLAGLFSTLSLAEMQIPMTKVANPCAMKNACNPCAAKNACNPCARTNPCMSRNPCNPCTAKNPCMAKNPCNPCAATQDIDPKKVKRPAGTQLYAGMKRNDLVRLGEKLFKDQSLSSNGLSCNDCHATNDLFNASFTQSYPHPVSMAKQRAGVHIVAADEFVQFCMMAPMAAEPLPWESKELAALTAYVLDVKQPNFIKMVKANPCFLKKKASANPCNPCAANPCAAGKNMTNNPCNPCLGNKP